MAEMNRQLAGGFVYVIFDRMNARERGRTKAFRAALRMKVKRSTAMAGLTCFYPDVYLDSTYEIDFEALYREGFRGVIFDIDNTLVPTVHLQTRAAWHSLRGLRISGLSVYFCQTTRNRE